jgi:hypothetical protein
MSEPIVLISNHRIRAGKADEYRRRIREGAPWIAEAKPGTVVFLGYLNEEGTEGSIVHAFPDQKAMELHFEGAAERGQAMAEVIEIESLMIYGTPNDTVLEALERARESGIELRFKAEPLGGYMRLEPK